MHLKFKVLINHYMQFIEVFDNTISNEDQDEVRYIISKSHFKYGITDDSNKPPSGLKSTNVPLPIIQKIVSFANSQSKNVNFSEFQVESVVVNLFISNELPYFHTDIIKGITIVYYCNETYPFDELGETQFLIKDNNGYEYIQGVQPKSGRIVIFTGSISHRATTFRSKPRFTIAIQMSKKCESS